jgi:hypothetical protein
VNTVVSARAVYGRLFLLAVLVASFTIGMTLLLITFKLENTQRDLRHGRFELIARDLDSVLEKNLLLGINLDEMTTLMPVLERRRQVDSAILSIDVSDTAGKLLYSTDVSRLGAGAAATFAPTWQTAIRQQRVLQSTIPLIWRVRGEIENVAGTSIENSFGVTQGYIAVRYAGDDVTQSGAALRASLRPVAWMAFAATAVAVFLTMAFLTRRFDANARRAITYLTTQPHDAPDDSVLLRGGWEPLLAPLRRRVDEAEAALLAWHTRKPE